MWTGGLGAVSPGCGQRRPSGLCRDRSAYGSTVYRGGRLIYSSGGSRELALRGRDLDGATYCRAR